MLSADEVEELYELEKPSGKNSPSVKVPDFVPSGPGIDYKKKLEEAEARLEELKALDKKADADVVERRERLVKLEDEISVADKSLQDANTSQAACEKECETLRANLLAINGAIGVEDARIYGLNGKIGDSEKQLTELENDKSKLEEDIAETERKASVPHTPGWHFIDGKGWLWTHPDYFPLVYSQQLTGWFYYKPGSQAPWLYYEYNTKSWQEW
jgi:DNA repair exonuclease SbcCD ATPase subunit